MPTSSVIKKSHVVRDDALWELIAALSVQLGYPSYHEELVIYIDPPAPPLRLVLTKDSLTFRWTEAAGHDEHHSLKRVLETSPRGIKEKLWFATKHYGNAGKISSAGVLSFPRSPRGFAVEIRPETFAGPLLSMSFRHDFFADPINHDAETEFLKSVAVFLLPQTLGSRIQKADTTVQPETILRFGVADEPLLNDKISDFCRRNGITRVTKHHHTYRELLKSRQNDYSAYQLLFENLTGTSLLSVDEHAHGDGFKNETVSVIIPCFNSNDTIHFVLDALASQELPEDLKRSMEVILIDDGSSVPVASELSRDRYPFRIEILRLESNRGVSNARLLGVTHATGHILMFMDADVLPSRHYVLDHVARNTIIRDAIFVSFKENVERTDPRVAAENVRCGLDRPNYARDLRITKEVRPGAIGNYEVRSPETVRILEDTNYFKAFHGSRVFGVYDLGTMITGHNFTIKRELVLDAAPFSKAFTGWGMEDAYLGYRVLLNGNFVIPVLSSGVYHLDHPPRSGSEEKKREEYDRNRRLVDEILDSTFE